MTLADKIERAVIKVLAFTVPLAVFFSGISFLVTNEDAWGWIIFLLTTIGSFASDAALRAREASQ